MMTSDLEAVAERHVHRLAADMQQLGIPRDLILYEVARYEQVMVRDIARRTAARRREVLEVVK